MDKIKINCRDHNMYPYSITIMGQERVLIKEKDIINLYDHLTQIILDNEELL